MAIGSGLFSGKENIPLLPLAKDDIPQVFELSLCASVILAIHPGYLIRMLRLWTNVLRRGGTSTLRCMSDRDAELLDKRL
jgi:hypothetical protein